MKSRDNLDSMIRLGLACLWSRKKRAKHMIKWMAFGLHLGIDDS